MVNDPPTAKILIPTDGDSFVAGQETTLLREPVPPRPTQPPDHAPMLTLRILGGRKDKIRPGDILGALTGEGGLSGDDIGKIEILTTVSYVAVAKKVARQAYQYLSVGRIKARRFRVELLD